LKLSPYSGYKASGVEWMGDVPKHWHVDRLKWSTLGTVNGFWGEEPNGVDDIICVRVADFDRDRFTVIEEPPTLRAIDVGQQKGRLLRQGDLLIEKSGGGEKQLVGCVVYFDHRYPAVCSNFVARMPVTAGMHPRFWVYVHAGLYAGRLNYPAIKQTTGIQNLDSSAYLEIRVCFPECDEQRTIADFLDRETAKLDTLVEKKRALIEKLKEKRAALISRTVTRGLPPDAARAAGLNPHPKLKPSGVEWIGDVPEHWVVSKLSRKLMVLDCKHKTVSFIDDGVPVASIREVHGFEVELAGANQTTDEEYLDLIEGDRKPRMGDIIYSRNATVGDAALVTTSKPFCMGQDVCLIRVRGNHPGYVRYFLRSSPGLQQVEALMIGSTFRRINVGQIKAFWICLPPKDEQVVITDYLDHETTKIDRLIEKVEAAIERLREYRTALITAAVTGKIDVRRKIAA
jgi:type I restriction enzyme, S subunit